MSRTIEPTLNREIREAVQAILDRNEMTEEDAGHLARLLNLVMGPRQEGDVDALKRVVLIHRAIRHVRGCFETGEIARLGTVLEDVQPLADAALAYANRKATAARMATSEEVARQVKRLGLLDRGISHIRRALQTDNRRYANEGLDEVPELNELLRVIDAYAGRREARVREQVEADLHRLRDGVQRALDGREAVGNEPLALEVQRRLGCHNEKE